jgi:hypothetical protein
MIHIDALTPVAKRPLKVAKPLEVARGACDC